MAELKTAQMTVVESRDLEAFIQEVYERPYSAQQGANGEYWGQDTYHTFTVPIVGRDRELYFEPEDVRKFERWKTLDPSDESIYPPESKVHELDSLKKMYWDRELSPPTDLVLDDLHQKGLLPAGTYLILCWW